MCSGFGAGEVGARRFYNSVGMGRKTRGGWENDDQILYMVKYLTNGCLW